MVDIEADGPIPGKYSMLSIGAVVVEQSLSKKFYAELKPISINYEQSALDVCGFNRKQTLNFEDPLAVMEKFRDWIQSVSKNKKPIFISDNNGFDWQFINYYFHIFLCTNPFGYSSMNLGSFYKGLALDVFVNFKHLRNTKHSHNALDDAIGNAEAMIKIKELYPSLKINL
jgi:DNA polymerase III epsilon subunit-like protein